MFRNTYMSHIQVLVLDERHGDTIEIIQEKKKKDTRKDSKMNTPISIQIIIYNNKLIICMLH